MKTEEILELFQQFEAIANDYEGVECWSARELCKLLGYSQWRNFENIVEKAKASCVNAGQDVSHHFADVSKMIDLAKGAQREVVDYMLTRHAPPARHRARAVSFISISQKATQCVAN